MLVLAAGDNGTLHPVAIILTAKSTDLKSHTQRELTETTGMLFDERDNIGLSLFTEADVLQKPLASHLADTDEVVTLGLHSQVNVMCTRHKSREVWRKPGTTLDHCIEVVVGNENYRALKLEALGQALGRLFVDQRALGHVRDDALVGRVKSRLEKGNGGLVKEHVVGIVKHQNRARGTMLVEELEERRSLHVALDDAVGRSGSVPGLERLLDGEALAETGRTGNDQRTNVTVDCGVGHVGEDFKAIGELLLNLLIRLNDDGLRGLSNVHDLSDLISLGSASLAEAILRNATGHVCVLTRL